MKPTLYLETSVVSYCTGRPSRDLVVAGRQQITRDWWESERRKYSLYVSALVLLQESQRGESEAIRKRQQILRGIPLLGTTKVTAELAESLVKKGPIPREYPEDALHIAVASTNAMNYLLTWNFRHINNATMKADVARIIADFGFECPVICTPEELLGDSL